MSALTGGNNQLLFSPLFLFFDWCFVAAALPPSLHVVINIQTLPLFDRQNLIT